MVRVENYILLYTVITVGLIVVLDQRPMTLLPADYRTW